MYSRCTYAIIYHRSRVAELILRWLIQPNTLVVRSRPSASMADHLDSEERKRIQEQIILLGPDGLAKQAKIVAEAKSQAQEESMPDREVESIPIPDVKTISWVSVQSASTIADSDALERYEPSSEPLANHLKADAVKLPFALHFDHVSVSHLPCADILNENCPVVTIHYYYGLHISCYGSRRS